MSGATIDFAGWIRGITDFAADVFRAGGVGSLKMTTYERLSLEEAEAQLSTLDPIWQEAIDFLRRFYTEVSAGFEFTLSVEMPAGWENSDNRNNIHFGLWILTPKELHQRIQIREDQLETNPPGLYDIYSAAVMPYYLVEGNRVLAAIYGDCLDLCCDDTGGTFVYYPGSGAYEKGIYAVDWDIAFFVSGTFEGFLKRLDEHCYLYPIPANQWKSDWGPKFRERLRKGGDV